MDAGSTAFFEEVVGVAATAENALLTLALFGVFAAIVKLVGAALASWAEARVAGDVGANVRLTVLDDVLSLEDRRTARHDRHGSASPGARNARSAPAATGDASDVNDEAASSGGHADRLAALTSHVADVERGVAQGVLAELRALMQLVPLGVLLVLLAPKLAGSAVVALGGFGLLAFALRRAFKRAHARAAASAGALVEAADEAVRHAELWATYGAKRRIRSHVASVGRAIAREAARIRVRASLLSSTSEVLGAIALVLALLLASRGALGVDHGTVVPFAIAFFMAYRPLRELVDARLLRARGEAALDAALGNVGERGERPDADAKRAPALPLLTTWTLDPLVLTAVRARHGSHAPLSLEVAPGSIAAVVGPTGIGKTSLLRALLGLEGLTSGEIWYGTLDLDAAGVGPGERPFAWVPQDAPIVGDTLAINVGLGRADDDAAIPDPRPVLAQLGNDELATSLGDQVLGTVRPLSGGERQWVAVARALATGLPVLLLDEPTSALDAASQTRLLEGLARLRGKRTVIIVTHRPEPLAIADVIVRLDAATVPSGLQEETPAPTASVSREPPVPAQR